MIAAGFMNNLVFEITADYSGNVVKGFMIDTESGERTLLKIAKPGDKNYYASKPVTAVQMQQWGIPTRITVPAGTFTVTGRMVKHDDSDNYVDFLMNPKVKFGHVASYSVYPDQETGVA
jgi:pyrrolidone-carboxylate peptidase